MRQSLLEGRALSYINSSNPENIQKQVDAILFTEEGYFSGRDFPEERRVEFSWAPRLGITSISFPLGNRLASRGASMGFERGLWVESCNLVRWVLMVPDDTTEVHMCLFSNERAIAARSVLYGIVSGLKSLTPFCRSGWGSTPDMQCIGCGRVYAIGLGWSDVSCIPLKPTPKIICPECCP
ncbi:MAG: hypothetical protein A3J55_04420 [Candidatus Ryanbacteria bacterium RIFCSPHIGHO2_02_FULL_45_17b]|uniref:Uncharacterized protein n=1 Tax=Candidatus Ryanbacteria bacterium RIFCSPHIGHO2_01_FULL_45_22 TaxID=1802114 RepID=A0A1G2G3M9_9BACT|nr:MAG: hypothetical protein A2719_04995 [Candidatus Ryanbacteria bacterium RIFCSPHIGHO2_01_FULL_45_22]OGZ47590.1 MAG: hypothetical protein A3J55_04420 [Candidatus Ryanbacteria bacterium RIFCSPHIGHO2_02_FULL_45_17b]